MNEILEKIKKISEPVEYDSEKINYHIPRDEKDLKDLISAFKFEFDRAGGKFFESFSNADLIDKISDVIKKEGVKSLVLGSSVDESTLKKIQQSNPDLKVSSTNSIPEGSNLKNIISSSDLSISYAEYLIAETGTIVVFARNEESRLLSILSPVNLMIADKSKILPDMDSLLKIVKDKYGKKIPHSAIIFITGPSRTADIEKILIIGVHGPREQYLILK